MWENNRPSALLAKKLILSEWKDFAPLTYGQWVGGVMCNFQLEKFDIKLKCTRENSMPLNNHLYCFVIGMAATSIIIWPMCMFLWVVFDSSCFYLLSLIVLNFVYDNPRKEHIYMTISHYTCIFLYGCLAKNTLIIQYLGKGDGQELVFNCPLFKLYLFLWYVLKITKDSDKLTFSSFYEWDLTEQTCSSVRVPICARGTRTP